MTTAAADHPSTPDAATRSDPDERGAGLRVLPEPGHPATGSSWRYLAWLAAQQWRTLSAGMVCGMVWMVSLALVPAALGRAIDVGLLARDGGGLLRWSAAVAGLGLLAAVMGATRHYFAVGNWLRASLRSARIAERGIRDAGPAMTRQVPTGEVIAVLADDVFRLGGLYDVTARFAGAILSYVVVAAILIAASPGLGLLVLLGCPVLLGSLGLVVRPLQRRQAEQREQSGRLTTLGADTVAGLRVLRGIGGEQTFLRRYEAQSQRVRQVGVRVAGVQATLDSAQVLLPGVFVVLVTWLGARQAITGEISPGQLVAFYGYSAFLTMPLRTATEFLDRLLRANIGARRVLRLLAVRPDHPRDTGSATASATGSAPPPTPDARDDLHDTASAATVRGGWFTAVVSARPDESAALADRLGRLSPDDASNPEVRWGDVPLASLPVGVVRRRILVSEADPRLFTGPLRGELWAGWNGADGAESDDGDADQDRDRAGASDLVLLDALEVASGADVLDALEDGLDSEVEERGRSFSGGQRQRLSLTRALVADRDVLVLVEPTSAVDTHTESRIAERLVAARAGRTTVVTTVSPLLLDLADEVLFLQDGHLVANGTHRQLLDTQPGYRRVVHRGEED